VRNGVTRLLVPALALAGALGSGTWLVTQESSAWASTTWRAGDGYGGTGMMGYGGTGMMGYGGTGMMAGAGLRGNDTPVDDLAEARDRAELFAGDLGGELQVGEIMEFENHYYADLLDADGAGVTEVLVDPRTGVVRPEYGPAMMWNTRYGMAGGADSAPELSADEAVALAEPEVDAEGLTVGAPETFPGYYTMHTLRDGEIEGMLSVNAVTGEVWHHSWHGAFVAMSEDG
jgi:hypothetical protein